MSKLNLNKNFTNTHILHSINWEIVPECVKNDLHQIYCDFKKQYKPSLPTIKSINKAKNLLKKQHSKTLTVEEKTALKDMKRIPWIKSLCTDAANEYRDAMCKAFGVQGLDIELKIWPSAGEVIYLDQLLRYPYKMATIQKLSKLRCKARKSAGLDKKDNVGF